MPLLQISEPGQSPDPHQRRTAIGIDLGTTHSLVAVVRHGAAVCLPDAEGRVLLPSVVRYLEQGGRQIGHEALAAQVLDAKNTISSVKRFMGRGLLDIANRAQLPVQFVPDTPGMLLLQTIAGEKSPVQVSAEILAVLRQRAEDSLDATVDGAVITVPAYFDEAQRQATKDAATLAGLPVLRLISEPTAAAIAYGLENQSEGVYAVYDLGGGTFDISILRLSAGVFEVMATGGDSALGGDDYDRALADWALARAGLGIDTLSASDKAGLQRAARACKEALSVAPTALFSVQLARAAIQFEMKAADFETATAHLTQRTLAAARQALRDAGVGKADVQGVVLVGGATRMPQVKKAVNSLFGKEPLTNLNPDEVVALGAAISANQLIGNAAPLLGLEGAAPADLLLLDVIALSLGIETMGGLVERIVPRNQTIPTAMAQDFTTFKDGQTALALHVVQGERDRVADCRSLARFELRGIAPMAAGAARIRVTFTVDADGLLNVHAREQISGVETQIDVKPSFGLSDEDIARMLQESFGTAQQDMQARALLEAGVDADRMLLAVQSALAADGDLLSGAEKQTIGQAQKALIAMRNPDAAQQVTQAAPTAADIEAATQALAKSTEAFAALRMNEGIRKALAGKNIAAV